MLHLGGYPYCRVSSVTKVTASRHDGSYHNVLVTPSRTDAPGTAALGGGWRRRVPRLSSAADRHLAGPAVVLLICLVFCWKLVLTHDYTWVDDPDMIHMDVPRFQFQATAWHHAAFPLWDPRLWCGQPFLGEIVGAAFPLNWPFFLLPLDAHGHVSLDILNWYFLVLHCLGALFTYWLCRELGPSRLAAIAGGIAYSFCGFLGVTHWPEVLGGLILAPLVLLFQVRAMRGRRPFGSAALCGVFLGLAWLSGHHEVPTWLTLTVAALWMCHLFWRRFEWRRIIALAALSFALMILTSGFQTLPGYEYGKLAVRWVGADHALTWGERVPYSVDEGFSFQPRSLVCIIAPWLGPNPHGFTGVIVFSLALVALVSGWSNRWVRTFAAIAMGGLLLALGGSTPLHGIIYALIPFVEKSRNTARIIFLFNLGMAVLVAFAIDQLRQTARFRFIRGVCRALLAFTALIFALTVIMPMLQKGQPDNSLWMAAFMAAVFAALLYGRRRGALDGRAFALLTLGFMIVEVNSFSSHIYLTRDGVRRPDQPASLLPELTRFEDIAAFLRTQPGPVRVETRAAMGGFNFGDASRI